VRGQLHAARIDTFGFRARRPLLIERGISGCEIDGEAIPAANTWC
jgi:hypothetical protein